MNASCNPLFEMRLSQADLKALFERNKQLAQLNHEYRMGYAESMGKHDLVSGPQYYPLETNPAKRSKYGNIKVEYQGMKFDSKKELKCWQELELRQKAGEIYDLQRQVPYPLFVNGIRIGRFTADFTWKERIDETLHRLIVADCKSPATRKETAYRLRKKIMEAQYDITIREL